MDMQEKLFFVYIMANMPFGVFYIGVTSDLIKRAYERGNKLIDGFTKRYNLTRLVYYEMYRDAETAIKREKTLKRWSRQWEINIVTKFNPDWNDLYENICG